MFAVMFFKKSSVVYVGPIPSNDLMTVALVLSLLKKGILFVRFLQQPVKVFVFMWLVNSKVLERLLFVE